MTGYHAPAPPSLDRVDYVPGQRLDRDDLTQASARTAALLDLHIARGHDVWGVATGYACGIVDDGVSIGTGVAIDIAGHQLINAQTRTVPLPPVPATIGAFAAGSVFDLVVCYDPRLATDCDRLGLPAERATVRWVLAGPQPGDGRAGQVSGVPYAASMRLGMDVPLARLTVPAQGDPTLDLRSRPVAHGLVRPKIATGQIRQASTTVVGTYTNWTVWIDTTAAGFVSASPAYLVSLDAHPFGDTADLGLGSAMGRRALGTEPPPLATRMTSWGGPFVSIEAKGQQGLQLRVCGIADDDWARAQRPGRFANPVPISWVGVETVNRPFVFVRAVFLEFSRARFGRALGAQKGGVW